MLSLSYSSVCGRLTGVAFETSRRQTATCGIRQGRSGRVKSRGRCTTGSLGGRSIPDPTRSASEVLSHGRGMSKKKKKKKKKRRKLADLRAVTGLGAGSLWCGGAGAVAPVRSEARIRALFAGGLAFRSGSRHSRRRRVWLGRGMFLSLGQGRSRLDAVEWYARKTGRPKPSTSLQGWNVCRCKVCKVGRLSAGTIIWKQEVPEEVVAYSPLRRARWRQCMRKRRRCEVERGAIRAGRARAKAEWVSKRGQRCEASR
ncbi:uncharacterized protein J3D65DRAFT_225759 [Phyllosticta citribraziliensis]|uniref:Uncharacterized protein n=1 Tax=Phyllosticta citribraziliensis TaxID=989973 RepID=A0ABR1M534_9PEZI